MKIKRPWIFRLDDILEAIEDIQTYTTGKNFDEFKEDKLLYSGCVRWLSIIGEAANHIPPEIQKKYADIPWPQITGLRNVIVHDYHFLDASLLWGIIRERLGLLHANITLMKSQLANNLE